MHCGAFSVPTIILIVKKQKTALNDLSTIFNVFNISAGCVECPVETCQFFWWMAVGVATIWAAFAIPKEGAEGIMY